MESSATTYRKDRTFSSASYLEGLMAELDRAGISIRMAQARDTAGPTQPEMAELLQPPVHFRTVQDWESPKKHAVPFDRLDEWARLTNTTREWLLYGVEDESLPQGLAQQLADAMEGLAEVVARFESIAGRLEALPGAKAPARSDRKTQPSG